MGFGCAHLRRVFLVNPEIGWLGQVRWANHCRASATGQAFSILGKKATTPADTTPHSSIHSDEADQRRTEWL